MLSPQRPNPISKNTFVSEVRERLRKPTQVFISSTFLDFQEERNIIMKEIHPYINNELQTRGCGLVFYDLRWGVTEEESNNGEVIRLCLDVIKESDYFICLIGNRVGTSRSPGSRILTLDMNPNDEDIKNNPLDKSFLMAAAKSEYSWVLEEDNQFASITELEIKYALKRLKDGKLKRADFYIRQHTKAKQSSGLRNISRNSHNLTREGARFKDVPERIGKILVKENIKNICSYLNLKEFKQKLIADWKFIIESDFNHLSLPNIVSNLTNISNQNKSGKENLPETLIDTKYFVPTPSEDLHLAELIKQEIYAETRMRVFIDIPEIPKLFASFTEFALSLNSHSTDCLRKISPPTTDLTSIPEDIESLFPKSYINEENFFVEKGQSALYDLLSTEIKDIDQAIIKLCLINQTKKKSPKKQGEIDYKISTTPDKDTNKVAQEKYYLLTYIYFSLAWVEETFAFAYKLFPISGVRESLVYPRFHPLVTPTIIE